MKTKLLIIKLRDGRLIKRDISKETFKDARGNIIFNPKPADLAEMAMFISMHGVADLDRCTDTRYVHIAPGFIEDVDLDFDPEN